MPNTFRSSTRATTLSILWLAVAAPSCTLWEVPEEDAGEAAFAAQAIHTLLGRPPKGPDEVRAIVRLLDDRAEIATVLMQQPEFVDYWAQVLLDDLGVDRFWDDAGAKALARTCYGAPMMSPTHYQLLVDHISTGAPNTAICLGDKKKERLLTDGQRVMEPIESEPIEAPIEVKPAPGKPVKPPTEGPPVQGGGNGGGGGGGGGGIGPGGVECHPLEFNMVDVARAAVATDRLDVLYLAYLGPLATLPFENNQESNRGDRLWEFYLDRDPSCLECHSTTYSTTDQKPSRGNLDGTYPVGEYLGDAYRDRYADVVGSANGAWSHGHRFTVYDVEGAALSNTNDTAGFTWTGGNMPRYGGHFKPPTASTISVDALLRDNVGTVRPWGMDGSCFPKAVDSDSTPGPDTFVPGGITYQAGGAEPGRFTFGLDGASTPTHVMPLMRALQRGLATTRAQGWNVETYEPAWNYGTLTPAQRAQGANSVGWVSYTGGKGDRERTILGEGTPMGYRCFDCHPNPNVTCTCGAGGHGEDDGSQTCDPLQCPAQRAPDLAEILPKMSATKLATILKDGSGEMPSVCPDYECGRLVAAYLAEEPVLVDWSGDALFVDAEHVIGFDEADKTYGKAWGIPHAHRMFPRDRSVALAHMVAMTAADRVFEEVYGSRLTIEFGFPRTPDQADVLYEATSALLGSKWSLRGLLHSLVLSPMLNRAAPFDPARDADLPMFVNPWVATEPTGAGTAPGKYWPTGGNGSGDVVHKRSVPALLHGIHESLGWPAPRVYSATDTAYPSTTDQVRVGRYLTLLDPGETSVQLREYVYYEQLVGRCQKPAGTPVDWIDKLVDKAGTHATADVSDLFIAVKARLITDPSLESGEADDIVDVVNDLAVTEPLAANTPTRDVPAADLQLAARTMCGVILRTPDFLLDGMRPNPESLLGQPELWVTLPGEPNGPFGWCHHYEGVLEDLGFEAVEPCHPGGGPVDQLEQPL